MNQAEQFFYDNAGWSYHTFTETSEEGRARCARELAEAEAWGSDQGFWVEWVEDWSVGSHRDFYGEGSAYEDREPASCETALVHDASGEVVASLGCIDDADDAYYRVVEAELMSECLGAHTRSVKLAQREAVGF